MWLSVWWLLGPAWAQDEVDDGEDLDIGNRNPAPAPAPSLTPKAQPLGDIDDEPVMADFAAAERKKAPPPVRWHVDVAGKQPLTDTFDIQVLAYDDQLVLAQLPVLVAKDRASFLAEHPGGLLVQADVSSGGTKRVIVEHVTADGVYESAPTLVFLQAAIPNPALSGDVRFLVRTQELPPPPDASGKAPPKPPPPPAPLRERFARTTVWTRGR
jgi:hypothetical protein